MTIGPELSKSLPFGIFGGFCAFVGSVFHLLADRKWGGMYGVQANSPFALPFLASLFLAVGSLSGLALFCCHRRVSFRFLRYSCGFAFIVPVAFALCYVLADLPDLRTFFYVPAIVLSCFVGWVPILVAPLAKLITKDSKRRYCSPWLVGAVLFASAAVVVEWAAAMKSVTVNQYDGKNFGWTFGAFLARFLLSLSFALVFAFVQRGLTSDPRLAGPLEEQGLTALSPLLQQTSFSVATSVSKLQTLAVVFAWLFASSLGLTFFYALCPLYQALPVVGTPEGIVENPTYVNYVQPVGGSIGVGTAYTRFKDGVEVAFGVQVEESSNSYFTYDYPTSVKFTAIFISSFALRAFGITLACSVSPLLAVTAVLCGQTVANFIASDFTYWSSWGGGSGEWWNPPIWSNNLTLSWNLSLSFGIVLFFLSFVLNVIWEYVEHRQLRVNQGLTGGVPSGGVPSSSAAVYAPYAQHPDTYYRPVRGNGGVIYRDQISRAAV